MPPTVSDIIKILEKMAPPMLAEDWDNVGLQIGHADRLVRRIWVALDPTLEVVHAACEHHVDLLITHHPLFFSPTQSIDLKTPLGAIIEKSIQGNLAVYSAHTNLDSVEGGLNDILSDIIGIENRSVLASANPANTGAIENKHGLGRIGELAQRTDLAAFGRHVKSVLKLNTLRMVGPPDLPVKRIALCTGSGSSLLKTAIISGADAFLTGDIRYHDAKSAQDHNFGLIDIGHFNSEHIMVEAVAKKVLKFVTVNHWPVEVTPCIMEKDPFKFL